MAELPRLRLGISLDSQTFVQETRRVGAAIDRMGGDVSKQSAAIETGFGRVNTAISAAKNVLIGFGAAIGVSGLVSLGKQIVATADEFQKLSGRLQVALQAGENLADVQERLFEVSQRTRQDLGTSTELFTRLANAMRDSGAGAQELLGVTETLAQAVAVSGASATEANAALIQLSQGLASGQLRGDELNSVFEQTPRLARAIAEGLDVPIGKLRELAKEGELTTEAIIGALQDQAPVIAAEFAKVPITVSDAMQQVRNAFTQLVGDSERSTQATQQLAAAISELGTTMGSPEFRAGFQEFLAEGVQRISGTIREFQRLKAAVVAAATAFVQFKNEAVGAVEAMATGVETWLGDRLQGALEGVQARTRGATEAFRAMYEAVVGGSYVPDMVTEIRGWMEQLGGPAMVDPAEEAVAETAAAFKALKEAEERELAQERQARAEEFVEPFRGAAQDIRGDFRSLFVDIFDDGEASFEDLAKSIKDTFVRLAADLATTAIFQPQTFAQGIFGAGAGARGFGLGSLAAGGLGAVGGSLIGGAFGGQGQLGGGIGGGLGAALGFGIGGPIGGLIGGIGGSLLGGGIGSLFGGGGGQSNKVAFGPGALGLAGAGGTGAASEFIRGLDQQVVGLLSARQEAIVNQALASAPSIGVEFSKTPSANDLSNLARSRIGPAASALGLNPDLIAGQRQQFSAEQQAQNLQTAVTLLREIEGFRIGPVATAFRDLDETFAEMHAEATRLGVSTAGLAEAQARANRLLTQEFRKIGR